MTGSTLRRGAGWLAERPLPTSLRAVLGHYAHSGVFDAGSLRLKRRVDREMDAIRRSLFADVEDGIADELGLADPTFAYDTKLLMPAELTLGYCYRRLDDPDRIAAAEQFTELVVAALLEGDVRDARNDDEFDDFLVRAREVDAPLDRDQRRTVAAVAEDRLGDRVDDGFATQPTGVRTAYERAVEVSTEHQRRDDHFRDLARDLAAGETGAARAVREEYRDADFPEPPESLADVADELPYLKTQYDRVGVIYEGMLEMYREAGFDIDPAYERSIVLAIVAAQIWLDDVDDYADDVAEDQLTPVTAEYLLADSDREGYERVVDLAESYLGRAATAATDADSPLTGIATEYIRYSGDPSVLPGSE